MNQSQGTARVHVRRSAQVGFKSDVWSRGTWTGVAYRPSCTVARRQEDDQMVRAQQGMEWVKGTGGGRKQRRGEEETGWWGKQRGTWGGSRGPEHATVLNLATEGTVLLMSVQKEGKEKAGSRPQKGFFNIEIGLIVSEKGLISIYQQSTNI